MSIDATMDAPARPVFRLADYAPPPWLVKRVALEVMLHETDTRIRAEIAFRANPAAARADLRLDGRALEFVSAAIDGQPLACLMAYEHHLRELIEQHVEATGSEHAARILEDLSDYLPRFWLVTPRAADLSRMLEAARAAA